MHKYHCLLAALPDIHSIHIYNDMHCLYGRAITAQGMKVAELMTMTPSVLASYFGGIPAAETGALWLAEKAQEPAVYEQLKEIGAYLQNQRCQGNLFAIIHIRPSIDGACQNHEVLITNKHTTTARQFIPSCAIAALALGCASK
jgi:hypothetical protein